MLFIRTFLFLVDCVREKGRIYAVDSHAIKMKEKSGKMTPHFGQDSLMVYTTHKCTLLDHISQLTKVKNDKPDCVSNLQSYDSFYNLKQRIHPTANI